MIKEYELKYTKYKGNYYPIIPVSVMSDKEYSACAYIDSGATYSVFSSKEGIRFGIDIEEGELIYLTVGDGGQIPVFLHDLKIRIGDHTFNPQIGFSERLGIGFNILGRRDIFDEFVICFDDMAHLVKIIER